jgi:lactate dehydrogenase-like 2-hydroxyacid dehydrogenase
VLEKRLKILVTRRWPEAVEAALAERYDVTFNHDDVPLTGAELVAAMREYDVLCPTITDKLSRHDAPAGDPDQHGARRRHR